MKMRIWAALITTGFCLGCATPRTTEPVLSSPLSDAVKCRNLAAIQALIAKGVELNALDRTGGTSLTDAVRFDDDKMEVIKLLLDSGAALEGRDKFGMTPLIHAAKAASSVKLNFLIGRGAKVSAMDDMGQTALHFAAQNGRIEDVKRLVAQGIDVNARKAGCDTPLILCAGAKAFYSSKEIRHTDVFMFLVARGADLNATGRHGRTPLLEAAEGAHLSAFTYLVTNGANVNAADMFGNTALIEIMRNPYYSSPAAILEAVEQLVSRGANVNAKSRLGDTPLIAAARRNTGEVVKLLVARGADVKAPGEVQITPEMTNWFGLVALAEGVQPSQYLQKIQDEVGQTPLGVTSSQVIIELLADKGADVNAKTAKGVTALMRAAEEGDAERVKYLLSKGADPRATDKRGWTAREYCEMSRGRVQNWIVDRILENLKLGAPVEVKR